MHELKWHARIGKHRLERGHHLEHPQDRRGHPLRELNVGDVRKQCQRVAAGDDARPKDVGVGSAVHERLIENALQLGLLGGVIVALGAARWNLLGERLRVVSVKPVSGHRGGIDEATRLGVGRRLEYVAGALEVDALGVLEAAEDQEREMHHDVGARHELVD